MQAESGVIHVVAEQLEDLTPWLARLAEHGADIDALARCDEVRRPIEDQREAKRLGGAHNRLAALMREMPELASDLDVPARGSAHAPTRRAGYDRSARLFLAALLIPPRLLHLHRRLRLFQRSGGAGGGAPRSASTSARNSAVTSGRMPNHNSKPRTA